MKTVVLIYSSLLSAQLFITVFEAGNVLFCLFIVAAGLEQSHSIGIMPIMENKRFRPNLKLINYIS